MLIKRKDLQILENNLNNVANIKQIAVAFAVSNSLQKVADAKNELMSLVREVTPKQPEAIEFQNAISEAYPKFCENQNGSLILKDVDGWNNFLAKITNENKVGAELYESNKDAVNKILEEEIDINIEMVDISQLNELISANELRALSFMLIDEDSKKVVV